MSYNGCCFFAYNNSEIDYVKLAMLAALYVKKHMKNNNTCLITSEGDYAWLEKSQDPDILNSAFDEIVITNDKQADNIRTHYDSPWTTFDSLFVSIINSFIASLYFSIIINLNSCKSSI